MTTVVDVRRKMTIEEFLAMEEAAEEKHILWDGEVFSVAAMAGGTFDHGTVSANVIAGLHGALRGSGCRVMTSDVKVWVPSKESFVYPDATVLCGRPEAYQGRKTVLVNPSLIVEVLSEGTEKFDRGEKFEGYRSIASVRHYVMVSTTHKLVEHYERADGGAWLLRTYGAGETAVVRGPDVTLVVDELYWMALEEGA